MGRNQTPILLRQMCRVRSINEYAPFFFHNPTHVSIRPLLFCCYTAVILLLIHAVILDKIKKQQRLSGWMRCDIDRNSGRDHPGTAQSRGSPGAGGVMSGSAASRWPAAGWHFNV